MIIAHAPSGYILGTFLAKRMSSAGVSAKVLVAAAILGALAPDIDMAYFYLIDLRQTHHHKYISHWPIVWLGLTAVSGIWFNYARQSKYAVAALVFCLAAMLHLILDTVVGDIWWFAPFVDKPYSLFSVSSRWKPWWLNFLLHWSFGAEIVLCVWALVLYRRRRGQFRGAQESEKST